MTALGLLYRTLGIFQKKLSKEEIFILENELYLRCSIELRQTLKCEHKEYFNLFTFDNEMEHKMELYIIRRLINDLLDSESYTISGIAYYTQTPEEVIQDLLIGHKPSPLIFFIRKLIELHKIIKPDFYKHILQKITSNNEEHDE